MSAKPLGPRSLIGVLASRDDPKINTTLASLFTHFFNHPDRRRLENFHFVFTGGTYDRLFYGDQRLGLAPLDQKVADWLKSKCGATGLPSANEGGVIILSNLVSNRQCSIVWPFFAAYESHWLRPENLAFLRLCDQWHVKRLMNRGSVMVWFDYEAEVDGTRNLQRCPPTLMLPSLEREKSKPISFKQRESEKPNRGKLKVEKWTPETCEFESMTIALIAHDEMKTRMVEFSIDHESELNKFGKILATGTTGREVAAATSHHIDKKMVRCHSGPKGGDIEIATAILYDQCHVVIFFIDTLRSHPHIEDIRVVFQACMVKDQVVMITNEMHAREFMSRVIRGRNSLTLYP